jgi:hypothetical protein
MDKYHTAEHQEAKDREILAWNGDILKRFWGKYSPPDVNGCETWLGKPLHGYGQFWASGQMFVSHRAAVVLRLGLVDYAYQSSTLHDAERKQAGLCVGKLCGVHVRLGSDAENLRAPDFAKLDRARVEEIRTRYESGGVLQRELAEEYGVDQAQVSRIVNYKRWNIRSES